MPRGTWRHVTNAIVVPALWRIYGFLSRPDPSFRSGAINESPWTDTHTDKQAGQAFGFGYPPQRKSPFGEWANAHSPHYDFELEAICFEPLVSF